MDSSSVSSAVSTPPPPSRRGKYKKIRLSAKKRIQQAYRESRDWKTVAIANDVKLSSCRNFLNFEDIVEKKRGGNKPRILSEGNLTMMEKWIEDDPQTTLEEMKLRLEGQHNIIVSNATIHRALMGRVYTFKDCHYEPLQANCLQVKQARRDYVAELRRLKADDKIPIWIDETNFNLFTARTKGRSKRGTRVRSIRPAPQKGRNLHIIGAMSNAGFFYAKHARGSYNNLRANDWLRGMLRYARSHFHGLKDIVVICDNAPCHSRVEQVFEEDEFLEARLLRLSPYSPQLNPIENLWSQVKSRVKTFLREGLAAFMGPPRVDPQMTLEEFRLQYLENCAGRALAEIDPLRNDRFTNRLDWFYGLAQDLTDMPIGA
ncbi:hypothetical protein AeMF1_021091 [Aphanomyces euteiches]|nr:hypothetical protein AeMF1_021091 [Aphanomyces euteiches]